MARPEKPIEFPKSPIGFFAQKLRDRRDRGGTISYRELARRSHFSHAVLADAAAGRQLPSWQVTEAFVKACGADPTEVDDWKAFWEETYQAAGNLRRRLTDPAAPGRIVADHAGGGPMGRGAQLRPVQPDLAGADAATPQPETVRTLDDLRFQLQVLRIAAGNPSLRMLATLMQQYPYPGTYPVSRSSLSAVFNGKRRMDFDTFMSIVYALLHRADGAATGETMQLWRRAWSQAVFNEERPDLRRRQRYGNIYLMTDQQHSGPSAEIIAKMNTEVAAALLASLDATIAAQVLGQMPPKRQTEIATALVQLTGSIQPSAPRSVEEEKETAKPNLRRIRS